MTAAGRPAEVAIRPAGHGDVPALGRLGALLVAVHHDFDPGRFIAAGPGMERAYGSFLAGRMQRKDDVVLVAEAEGEVIGYAFAGLEGNDWMTLRGPAGVIYDLLVDPARRGQGVGRRLLEAMLQALAERGAPQVMLSTAHHNQAAQRLFTAAGFRPTLLEMTRDWPDRPR